MTEGFAVVDLGRQLAGSAVFLVVMVVVHSAGLVGISRALHLHDADSIPNSFGARAAVLMGAYGLLLFGLHFFEIFIFAGFFRFVGAMPSMEQALFYSASCYATLGSAAASFSEEWRLVGALEALVGFLLIGGSPAFMVQTLRRIID